jgi:hypothetical protein
VRKKHVARMEPPGPAFGRPDDKLREIQEQPIKHVGNAVLRAWPDPDFAALDRGYALGYAP